MNIIFRTYQFELQPTQEQKILLDKHFGCMRYVFNHFLNERKEQYQVDKKSDNYYAQAATLTELKKKTETIWLKEVNSQSLQFALRCLDTSFMNFYKGKSKFPRFKSKKNKNSFTVPQLAILEENKIYIPKFKEGIKVIIHREIKDKIGKCTFSKTPTGKYFVSILSEEQYQPKEKTGVICGIDLGLKGKHKNIFLVKQKVVIRLKNKDEKLLQFMRREPEITTEDIKKWNFENDVKKYNL